MVLGKNEYLAINTRRKYSECVRVRVSGVKAGEMNRMELQKGHEDLYRKEPSGHLSEVLRQG